MKKPRLTSLILARMFHKYYERFAPKYGWKTREESARPWRKVCRTNKRLMTEVCQKVIESFPRFSGT